MVENTLHLSRNPRDSGSDRAYRFISPDTALLTRMCMAESTQMTSALVNDDKVPEYLVQRVMIAETFQELGRALTAFNKMDLDLELARQLTMISEVIPLPRNGEKSYYISDVEVENFYKVIPQVCRDLIDLHLRLLNQVLVSATFLQLSILNQGIDIYRVINALANIMQALAVHPAAPKLSAYDMFNLSTAIGETTDRCGNLYGALQVVIEQPGVFLVLNAALRLQYTEGRFKDSATLLDRLKDELSGVYSGSDSDEFTKVLAIAVRYTELVNNASNLMYELKKLFSSLAAKLNHGES